MDRAYRCHLIILDRKVGGPLSDQILETHIPHAFGITVLNPMPPKPVSELTKVETTILTVAAKLFAAIKRVQDSPPTPEQLAQFNVKVLDKLVSVYTTYSIADT